MALISSLTAIHLILFPLVHSIPDQDGFVTSFYEMRGLNTSQIDQLSQDIVTTLFDLEQMLEEAYVEHQSLGWNVNYKDIFLSIVAINDNKTTTLVEEPSYTKSNATLSADCQNNLCALALTSEILCEKKLCQYITGNFITAQFESTMVDKMKEYFGSSGDDFEFDVVRMGDVELWNAASDGGNENAVSVGVWIVLLCLCIAIGCVAVICVYRSDQRTIDKLQRDLNDKEDDLEKLDKEIKKVVGADKVKKSRNAGPDVGTVEEMLKDLELMQYIEMTKKGFDTFHAIVDESKADELEKIVEDKWHRKLLIDEAQDFVDEMKKMEK